MTALRTLFALLVAANLVLALANLGGFSHAPGGEPERLSSQLHPEKLRIIKATEAQSKKTLPAPPMPENNAPPSPEQQLVATSAPAVEIPQACIRWAGLAPALANELAAKAKSAGLKSKADSAITPTSWWVHLPQQPDRASAEKKVADLQRLGITDYFIDPNNAVSLGLFKTEEAARRAFDQLRGKGVQGIRIDTRGPTTTTLELSGAQNLVTSLVNEASAQLAGIQRNDCAPAR